MLLFFFAQLIPQVKDEHIFKLLFEKKKKKFLAVNTAKHWHIFAFSYALYDCTNYTAVPSLTLAGCEVVTPGVGKC